MILNLFAEKILDYYAIVRDAGDDLGRACDL